MPLSRSRRPGQAGRQVTGGGRRHDERHPVLRLVEAVPGGLSGDSERVGNLFPSGSVRFCLVDGSGQPLSGCVEKVLFLSNSCQSWCQPLRFLIRSHAVKYSLTTTFCQGVLDRLLALRRCQGRRPTPERKRAGLTPEDAATLHEDPPLGGPVSALACFPPTSYNRVVRCRVTS